MRSTRMYRYGLLAICLAVLGVALVWPVLLTVGGAFVEPTADGAQRLTISPVLSVFRDPVLREGLANSGLIAVTVTLLSLLLAVPLAVIAARYEFRGKAVLSGLLLVPLILPPFVGAIGFRALFGRYGGVNALLSTIGLMDMNQPIDWLGGGWLPQVGPLAWLDGRLIGIVLMEALHLYPIVFLNVTAALANIDPAMEQAAANLGASPWTRFRRITLPLIRPGLFAGATIVFIWAFTELGTPLMFDYTAVTPVQVFWGIQEMSDSPRPFALTLVMLVIAAGGYVLGRVTFGGQAFTSTTRATVAPEVRFLCGGAAVAAALPFIVVTLAAIMPHIGVVLASFTEPGGWYRSIVPSQLTAGHYIGALAHPLASGSIGNSLLYAMGAMVLDIVLGVMIASLVVRGRVIGGRLLDALAMLPLAVPGLVMAFGYVAISLQIRQWFTAAGSEPPGWLQVTGEAPNPMLFLIVAYAIRRLPYVVRSAAAGLEQTPVELEEAALVLGASRWRVMRRVVVPLIMANLIAGGLLAFSFAMLEVSDSLVLAQTEGHFPITKAIYTLYERLGDGPYIASAMGVWGMALLTVTLVGASMLMGRRLGAVFRI